MHAQQMAGGTELPEASGPVKTSMFDSKPPVAASALGTQVRTGAASQPAAARGTAEGGYTWIAQSLKVTYYAKCKFLCLLYIHMCPLCVRRQIDRQTDR